MRLTAAWTQAEKDPGIKGPQCTQPNAPSPPSPLLPPAVASGVGGALGGHPRVAGKRMAKPQQDRLGQLAKPIEQERVPAPVPKSELEPAQVVLAPVPKSELEPAPGASHSHANPDSSDAEPDGVGLRGLVLASNWWPSLSDEDWR
eukprot:9064764-Pyramimonas_sp.AAC.1